MYRRENYVRFTKISNFLTMTLLINLSRGVTVSTVINPQV